MMEFVTIFFPLYESITSKRQQTHLSEHENHREQMESMDNTNQRGDRYSKASFEETLANDPSSLLNFAASKAFSGENIKFLIHIRDWKAAWDEDSNPEDFPKGDELHRHLFKVGVEIYATFVKINTAKFPVNIESGVSHNLINVFGQAAKLIDIPETTNIITPFDHPADNPRSLNEGVSLDSLARPSTASTSDASTIANSVSLASFPSNHEGVENVINIKPRLPSDLEIPNYFSASVFDEAESSIKMLVLRDTWPKYVDAIEELTSSGSEGPKSKKRFWPFRSRK